MIDKVFTEKIFSLFGISLSHEQLRMFDRYADLLVEWNGKMNLTAILKPEDIVIKHFLDSALPFVHVPLEDGSNVIDVGTGAGFPGIPLAILNPGLSLTLLDSLKKRLSFLSCVVNDCGLKASIIHGRAEDEGKNAHLREQFDAVTARAVANLRVLSEYCLPFLKVGGVFYALKSSKYQDELMDALPAIRILGGEVWRTFEYSLPDGSGRGLVCIKKVSPTPTLYPRSQAKIDKLPLK